MAEVNALTLIDCDEEYLHQWDGDIFVAVTGSAATVQFQLVGDTELLSVRVVEGQVQIPNILLQRNGELLAYARSNTKTLVANKWTVVECLKSPDYMYTPTEVETWGMIKDEVDQALQVANQVRSDFDALVADNLLTRQAAAEAQAAAELARDEAQDAQGASEAARDISVSAKNTAVDTENQIVSLVNSLYFNIVSPPVANMNTANVRICATPAQIAAMTQ